MNSPKRRQNEVNTDINFNRQKGKLTYMYQILHRNEKKSLTIGPGRSSSKALSYGLHYPGSIP